MESNGETSKFGTLSNGQVVILAAVESAFQLHTRGDIGTRWDLHSTSLGKAILAVLPDEEAREILERRGMPVHTRRTIADWEAMQAELAAIRKRGYALDLEENEAGIRCVAAAGADPLHGSVVAFSVSGPRDRVTDERIHEIGSDVMAAVRSLSLTAQEERA
jgi:IclR family KDG regulon transcriptional repressor